MSLLGMLWRLGTRLRNRRTHNHGGDDSASEESVPSVAGRTRFGLEFVCDGDEVLGPFPIDDSPDQHEFADSDMQCIDPRERGNKPTLGVLHDKKANKTAFTNNTPNGWISANDTDVIERRDMQ